MARNIKNIKFNAVDTDNNDYVEYQDWLSDEGFTHNNESLSKFLDEHFGCTLLEFTEHHDKNKKEIFEDDILITNNQKMKVIKLRGAFALEFESGDFYEYMCNLSDMGGKVYEKIGNIYTDNFKQLVT